MRGAIQVILFEAPQPIDAWRIPAAALQSRRGTRLRPGERAFATLVAVLVNVGFVLVLTFDSRSLTSTVGWSSRSVSSGLMQVYFAAPEVPADNQKLEHRASNWIRRIHTTVPALHTLRFDAEASSAGDQVWNPPPVASAISAASPELEEARLRSLYRDRIQYHLALHLRSSAATPAETCTLRLSQNADGKILDVAVAECGGSAESQRELLAEIRRATPLPGPPRPDLFAPQVLISIGKKIEVQL